MKKRGKLDKYRSHLIDGTNPKEGKLHKLTKYRKAHGLLCPMAASAKCSATRADGFSNW